MSDRIFLDTNILVYAFDRDEPSKRARSLAILSGDDELVLSTQVLQEFYVAVTRKLKRPLSEADAEAAVRELVRLEVVGVDTTMVLDAIVTHRAHSLSFWDALIVRSASAAGCDRLFSEDMQHGRDLHSVRIENPYVVA
jgi:predicted nucleic acid-binding protein